MPRACLALLILGHCSLSSQATPLAAVRAFCELQCSLLNRGKFADLPSAANATLLQVNATATEPRGPPLLVEHRRALSFAELVTSALRGRAVVLILLTLVLPALLVFCFWWVHRKPEVSTLGAKGSGSAWSPAASELSVVQFGAPVYYAEEGKGRVEVDVIRVGDLSTAATVAWETGDASAKAGAKYVASQGTLTFWPRDFSKTLEVFLVPNDSFDSATDFQLQLKAPKNCTIDAHLGNCRVKIVDEDTFPTNKYAEEIFEGESGIRRIPALGLLLEFLRFCLKMPDICQQSLWILLLDQLHNLYYLWKTYLMTIYVVDVLFARNSRQGLWAETRAGTAVLVALLLLLPTFILHTWDKLRLRADLEGRLRQRIQNFVFRKYLSQEKLARIEETHNATVGHMVLHADVFVTGGYLKVFSVAGRLIRVFVITCFIWCLQPLFVWLPPVIFLFMTVWVYGNSTEMTAADKERDRGVTKMMENLRAACGRGEVFVEYHKTSQLADEFGELLERMNAAGIRRQESFLHGKQLVSVLSTVSMAAVLLLSTYNAQKGISLGVLLAVLDFVNQLGEEMQEGQQELLELSSCIGKLRHLTSYMNSFSDQRLRSAVSARQRVEMHRKMEEGLKQGCNSRALLEEMPMKFMDLHFSYQLVRAPDIESAASQPLMAQPWRIAKAQAIQSPWTLRIPGLQVPQGRMVSILGKRKAGKRTVARLLAGIVCPPHTLESPDEVCELFVAPHLHIIHVSQEPHIIDKGLYANLTMGAYATPVNTEPERIARILERLPSQFRHLLADQLRKELSDESLRDGNGGAWRRQLSHTDKAIVHLVRALVANPEVLVMNCPFLSYTKHMRDCVMSLLKEHIHLRGLELNQGSECQRLPRTVIFTTEIDELAAQADVHLQLVHDWENNHSTLEPISEQGPRPDIMPRVRRKSF